MPKLSLTTATTIIDTALAEARRRNLAPLAVAVLDAGGNLIVFKREDGAGIARFDIAHGKAWGALGMGYGTRELTERAKNFPAFAQSVSVASGGRLIPSPGGVLMLDEDKQVIGAIGISGDTGDNDELCAVEAIKAVNLSYAAGLIERD